MSSKLTSLIYNYLAVKYNIPSPQIHSALVIAQKLSLYSEIKSKTLHQKLYNASENELFSIKDSSLWLRKGNIPPRDEAALCSLQDRNAFLGDKSKCPHCNSSVKTVDHLASRCDRLLGHDYTRRHNEVVRCIHLFLCNKYGLKSSKRIRLHSVQEILANEHVEIRVDTRVKTDVKIQHDRPDILVIDKRRREAVIIEIGITSQDLLKQVETEKLHKYDLLAGEIGLLHGCTTKIIPYVLSWDGIVTICHKGYVKQLGLPDNIESYIATRVLKRTLEVISLTARRSIFDEVGDAERIERAVAEILGAAGEEVEGATALSAEIGG